MAQSQQLHRVTWVQQGMTIIWAVHVSWRVKKAKNSCPEVENFDIFVFGFQRYPAEVLTSVGKEWPFSVWLNYINANYRKRSWVFFFWAVEVRCIVILFYLLGWSFSLPNQNKLTLVVVSYSFITYCEVCSMIRFEVAARCHSAFICHFDEHEFFKRVFFECAQ